MARRERNINNVINTAIFLPWKVLGTHNSFHEDKRSNQSILKEISPGCSLEGLMLKLKLQYFGHLMQGVDSWKRPWCWEGLGAGGEGDGRGWDGWMASPTRWTWLWVNSGSWWWTGRPGVLRFLGSQRVGHDWATELNWTDASIPQIYHNSQYMVGPLIRISWQRGNIIEWMNQ